MPVSVRYICENNNDTLKLIAGSLLIFLGITVAKLILKTMRDDFLRRDVARLVAQVEALTEKEFEEPEEEAEEEEAEEAVEEEEEEEEEEEVEEDEEEEAFKGLQELAMFRYKSLRIRVYWDAADKQVHLFDGTETQIQKDTNIDASLSAFLLNPIEVLECTLYESDGSISFPPTEPKELLECDWSDFASDRLFVEATLA
jgi:ABC-type Zn2+ transport system substrate-binding protein/surface adhesin